MKRWIAAALGLGVTLLPATAETQQRIDRQALVARHAVASDDLHRHYDQPYRRYRPPYPALRISSDRAAQCQ